MPTDAKGPYFVAEEDEFDFDLAAAIATESSKDESSQRLSDAVVNCLNAIDRVMGELQKTKEQPPNLLQFIDLLKKADNQIGVARELVRIFQAQLDEIYKHNHKRFFDFLIPMVFADCCDDIHGGETDCVSIINAALLKKMGELMGRDVLERGYHHLDNAYLSRLRERTLRNPLQTKKSVPRPWYSDELIVGSGIIHEGCYYIRENAHEKRWSSGLWRLYGFRQPVSEEEINDLAARRGFIPLKDWFQGEVTRLLGTQNGRTSLIWPDEGLEPNIVDLVLFKLVRLVLEHKKRGSPAWSLSEFVLRGSGDTKEDLPPSIDQVNTFITMCNGKSYGDEVIRNKVASELFDFRKRTGTLAYTEADLPSFNLKGVQGHGRLFRADQRKNASGSPPSPPSSHSSSGSTSMLEDEAIVMSPNRVQRVDSSSSVTSPPLHMTPDIETGECTQGRGQALPSADGTWVVEPLTFGS